MQFLESHQIFIIFCHGAADIFYTNKKNFPRVLAILYLPCTF